MPLLRRPFPALALRPTACRCRPPASVASVAVPGRSLPSSSLSPMASRRTLSGSASSSSSGGGSREVAKARIAAVDAAARQAPLKTGPGGAPPGVKQIVAVSSGKGGVGKSTTSVNLALSLSALGLRVGLLDADVYGPSIPQLMNLSGQPFLTPENKMIPLENYGIQVMSIGFLVDSPEDRYKPIVWRGPMLQKALQQLLHDVAWDNVDVLLVDMPPGTGDVQITITQRAGLAGAVVVSTPHDLALLDARRGLRMFEQLAVPILGVVENMSGYACTNCGHTSSVFGPQDGAQKAAGEAGVDFLGAVPLMPSAIGDNHGTHGGTPLAWHGHGQGQGQGTNTTTTGRTDHLDGDGNASADGDDANAVAAAAASAASAASLELERRLCGEEQEQEGEGVLSELMELSTQLTHHADTIRTQLLLQTHRRRRQLPTAAAEPTAAVDAEEGEEEGEREAGVMSGRAEAQQVYMAIAERIADKLGLLSDSISTVR